MSNTTKTAGLSFVIRTAVDQIQSLLHLLEATTLDANQRSILAKLSVAANNLISAGHEIQPDVVPLAPSANPSAPVLELVDVRLLVVDDNEVNLIIAQELLSSMGASVITAQSGEEAVELVKATNFDMIFMDHHMPGLSGVEATAMIRETHPDIPVIALTANAVPGSRDFYLSQSMSDFLPKPIGVTELTEVLRAWIPAKKQKNIAQSALPSDQDDPNAFLINQLAACEELDVSLALNRAGGNTKAFLSVMRTFVRVTPEKISRLRDAFSATEMKSFQIDIHAQKSALANIGAIRLSKAAREMENLCIAGNITSINPTEFLARLDRLYQTVCAILHQNDTAQTAATAADRANLQDVLRRMKSFLGEFDAENVEKIYADLRKTSYDTQTDQTVVALGDAIDAFDYDKAAELVLSIGSGQV